MFLAIAMNMLVPAGERAAHRMWAAGVSLVRRAVNALASAHAGRVADTDVAQSLPPFY